MDRACVGSSAPTPSFLQGVARLGALLLIALLGFATLDAARISAIGRTGLAPIVVSWTYSCVMAALVALILALGLCAISYLARGMAARAPERLRRHAGAHAYGALAAATAYALLRPWDMYSDRYHSAVLVPVLTWLGVASLRLGAHALPRRVYITATALSALALAACDALVLPGLYRTFHNVAAFTALLCATHAIAAAWPMLGRARPLRTLGALGLAIPALLAWPDNRAAREVAAHDGLVLPRLIALVAPLADRDADGFAPLFAGDCDDSDPAVHPGACELDRNHRDDNCNGHIDAAIAPRPAIGSTAPPPSPAPDVYFIVIDTLRADFARQDRARAMPALHRLAASGLDFVNAYTPYPSTHRAMLALATSRPHRYRSAAIPTAPTWFASAGYDAQLFIGNARLREQPNAPPVVGADRRTGDPFDVHGEDKTEWTARIVFDAIAELTDGAARAPRFRWLHLLDVHAPWLRGGEGKTQAERYRAEIAFVDSQLGRLFDALERDATGARAAIVVLSDHGEELGEHGNVFHGAALWQSSIKVPLAMRLPGVKARAIREVASLIDVMPTLAAYLRLPPHAAWHGHNWLSNHPAPHARVVSEVEPIANAGTLGIPARIAAVTRDLKLLVNVTEQLTDVYDLASDPDETQNLSGRHGLEARTTLEQVIATWEDAPDCVPPP